MSSGKVYLVGAGPGDPGLMTVRGLDLLRKTSVLIYDELVNQALLEEATAEPIKIFVGKRPGRRCSNTLLRPFTASRRSKAAGPCAMPQRIGCVPVVSIVTTRILPAPKPTGKRGMYEAS